MKNQYCKVGASKQLTNESVLVVADLYKNFIEKANNSVNIDTKQGDFFHAKAQKFEKLLKELY